jgi:hypothetical protein
MPSSFFLLYHLATRTKVFNISLELELIVIVRIMTISILAIWFPLMLEIIAVVARHFLSSPRPYLD